MLSLLLSKGKWGFSVRLNPFSHRDSALLPQLIFTAPWFIHAELSCASVKPPKWHFIQHSAVAETKEVWRFTFEGGLILVVIFFNSNFRRQYQQQWQVTSILFSRCLALLPEMDTVFRIEMWQRVVTTDGMTNTFQVWMRYFFVHKTWRQDLLPHYCSSLLLPLVADQRWNKLVQPCHLRNFHTDSKAGYWCMILILKAHREWYFRNQHAQLYLYCHDWLIKCLWQSRGHPLGINVILYLNKYGKL